MYKLTLITTIALLGCGGTKTDPSYVTKEEVRKLADSLTSCMESANKLTDKVNDHEARLTAVERHSLAQSGGSGYQFVLNTRAESEPVSSTRTPLASPAIKPSITPAATITPATSKTAGNNAPGALPEDDLAIKFGKFKQDTEAHFVALDATQKKQGEKIGEHSTALEKLTGEVKQLTEKVDSLKQTTEQSKQAVPGPNPSTSPVAEAPVSNPT